MEPFQPVRDTIGLLAGAPVHRSTRPGEQFEQPEKRRTPRHIRSVLSVFLTGFLLSFRLL